MERQAKDGTIYRQVGEDSWEPVTRAAKDGTIYKKVGQDSWAPLEQPKPEEKGMLQKVGEAIDSVTGAPTRAAIGAVQDGKNPLSAAWNQFAEDPSKAPTGKDIAKKAGAKDETRLARTAQDQMDFDKIHNPGLYDAKMKAGAYKDQHANPAESYGTLIDLGADWSNLVGVGEARAVAKVGGKYAGKAANAIGDFVGAGAKKGLSALGGVPVEKIDSYLANPERIRNAQSVEEIYDEVTGVVKGLFDDLDAKKLNYETAKTQLDEVQKGIKDSRVESKAAALEQVAQARAQLDEAFRSKKAGIADKASPTRLDPLVSDAMQKLRTKVSKGSGEAFDTLADHGELFDVNKVLKEVEKVRDSLNIAGVGPATPQAKAAQAEIDGLLNTFGKLPAQLLGPDVKKLIQQVDRAEKVVYDSGAFTNEVSDAFKTLRQGMDEQLKTVKPYAEKMAQVSDDTRVLTQNRDLFGKDSLRMSRLQNIGRPSAKYDLESLQRLAEKEGGLLPQMLGETVEAQRTLRSPMRLEGIKQTLPQNEAVRAAEMKAAAAKRLAKPRDIQQAVRNSSAFGNLQAAEAKFAEAKELANKFRSFGEQGAEAKLKAVAAGKIHATSTLEALSKLSDKDFVEAVRAANDAAAFEKTAFHGSRNVNLWTVIGAVGQTAMGKGGAGTVTGGILGGAPGAMIGAVTGAMMDLYGPAVTKRVLDGVIKIRGPITESAIRSLDVPEAVKKDLVLQFRAAMTATRTSSIGPASELPKAAENETPSELDQDSGVSAQEPSLKELMQMKPTKENLERLKRRK